MTSLLMIALAVGIMACGPTGDVSLGTHYFGSGDADPLDGASPEVASDSAPPTRDAADGDGPFSRTDAGGQEDGRHDRDGSGGWEPQPVPPAGTLCFTPWDCGGPPPSDEPNVLCPDGTLAGWICVYNRDGDCEWQPFTCDTRAPRDPCGGCRPEQYCEVDSCGWEGKSGVCEDRPRTCDRTDAPVCGCDGVTYPNSCVAHLNGTAVSFDGTCDPSHSR